MAKFSRQLLFHISATLKFHCNNALPTICKSYVQSKQKNLPLHVSTAKQRVRHIAVLVPELEPLFGACQILSDHVYLGEAVKSVHLQSARQYIEATSGETSRIKITEEPDADVIYYY